MKTSKQKRPSKTSMQLIGIFVFYGLIFYVRMVGHSTLPDFFSSSANEGIYELLIRLLITILILGSLAYEVVRVIKYPQVHSSIRLVLRFYVWLLFTNTILYRIYAIPLPIYVLHLCFALGFLVEVVLFYLENRVREDEKEQEFPGKFVKKDLVLTILSMILLIIFQADGIFGIVVNTLMYLVLGYLLLKQKRTGTITWKKTVYLGAWMASMAILIQYLVSMDLVINQVYLMGRTTLRFGFYLLMYLPLYIVVLQKKNRNLV